MNSDAISRHVQAMWNETIVPTLHEYIRIPNKSPAFDQDWEKHGYMDDAANLLVKWVAQTGISGLVHRVVRLEGRTPVILIDIPGEGANVLMYGHFDKQPEFQGWENGLGPWTPIEKDGRLYGRGGADDGYAIFASLAAISALQAHNLPHPRCLILIESCEESGSYDLPSYIDHLKDEIGEPNLVICLDAECGNYEQLWLTTSLRGTLGGTLNVEVLSEGVHSGAAGGIVPSSFRLLRQLLDRIENAVSGELLDFLQVPITDIVRTQADRVVSTLGTTVLDRFPWSGTTRPTTTSLSELVVANTWGSSMAAVGLAGAPEPSNAGNTLRPSTAVKLVFRLPPSLDAEEAANRVKSVLETNPPQGATVSFDLDTPQTGWHAKSLSPALLTSLDRSSKTFFGAPMMTMGTGGTIPFMKMLGDRFPACQFFVTGVLGPHSNAHGPNEFLHIDTGKRVTCCVAEVLADQATMP